MQVSLCRLCSMYGIGMLIVCSEANSCQTQALKPWQVSLDSPVINVGCYKSIDHIHSQVLAQVLQNSITVASKKLSVAVKEDCQSPTNTKYSP